MKFFSQFAAAVIALTAVIAPASAHLQMSVPPARYRSQHGTDSGGCCQDNPTRQANQLDEYRCDTGAKISTRESQTGMTMHEGRKYQIVVNLAVNHLGRVYHGIEEYVGKVGETNAETTEDRLLLFDQKIVDNADGEYSEDYVMELGAACDNCGWWSWYDTVLNNAQMQKTWNSCSDVTVVPLPFVINYADTVANINTNVNAPLTGQTVRGTIYPNVPMPLITSDDQSQAYANLNQIESVAFTLTCPTGAGGPLCVNPTPPAPDTTATPSTIQQPPAPPSAFSWDTGIDTTLLQNMNEPYTVTANVCFKLRDYQDQPLNRCREYTATFNVANDIYCDNPTQATPATPYACAADSALKAQPSTLLCGTAPGSCTQDICCDAYQTCDTYTCAAPMQARLDVAAASITCAAVACTVNDCCQPTPTCVGFPCPATAAAPLPNAAGITCASPATCVVTDCCAPNPTCSSVAATLCAAPGYQVSPTAAATTCAGPTCAVSDCCVASPTCLNPQAATNGSIRYACPLVPQLRTALPNFNTIVCAALGCTADECCSPVDPNRPVTPTPIVPPQTPTPIVPPQTPTPAVPPAGTYPNGNPTTDAQGNPIDDQGRPLDPNVNPITEIPLYPNGNPTHDANGNPLDPNGNPLNGSTPTPAAAPTPAPTPTPADTTNAAATTLPPQATPTPEEEDDDSSGAVVAIVVALLLLCCLLLAGLLWKKRRKQGNLLDYSGDVYRDVHAESATSAGLKGVGSPDAFVAPEPEPARNLVVVDSSSESESEPSIVTESESSSEEEPAPVESSSEEEVEETPTGPPKMAAPVMKKKPKVAPKAAAPKLRKAPKLAAPKLDKTPKMAAPVMKKKAVVAAGAGASAPVEAPAAVGAGGGGADPAPTEFLGVGAGAGGSEPAPVAAAGVAVGGGEGTEKPTEFHGVGAGAGEGGPARTRAATVAPKGQGRAGKGGAKAAKNRSNTVTAEALHPVINKDYSVSGNLVAVMPMQYADLIKNMAKKRGVDVDEESGQ